MIKEILENLNASEFGVYYSGDLFTLKIDGEHLLKFEISGEKTLINSPAFQSIIKDYKEEDEEKIREIYSKLFKEVGKNIEKLASNFEKELKKELNKIDKTLGKL